MASQLNEWMGRHTHPGKAAVAGTERRLVTHPGQDEDAFFPVGALAAMRNAHLLLSHSPFWGKYNVDDVTATLDNGSTVAPGEGGLVFTLGGADGDDTSIISKYTYTTASGQLWVATARVSLLDADKDGLWFGFWTAADAEIRSAEPTDGVWFESAYDAATLIGTVRGNSGTSRDTGTLATLTDGTDVELGMMFYIEDATANAWGQWWVNGTRTAFTANQLTELIKMGDDVSPQSLCCGLASASKDAADTVTVPYAVGFVHRS